MASHVSHSQLNSWMRCGKAYELNRIMKAPRTPAVWTASGVALHELLDLINRSSITDEPLDIKTVWDKTYLDLLLEIEKETGTHREHWKRAGRLTKDKPNKEDALWWQIEGYKQLLAYKQWLYTSGYRVYVEGDDIYSEKETTIMFGDVEVKGFLDAVMVTPGGELFVMDAKSGTRKPSNALQLGLYATAIKMAGGPEITKGAFFMTRSAEVTDLVDLSKYNERYFTPIFKGLRTGIDNEIFLPNPGDPCFTCDVKDACYTVGGPDAYKYDSLHPKFVGVSDLLSL